MATTVSIGDTSLIEGNAGTQTTKLTLTLSAPQATDTLVEWRTVDGTATAPDDYRAAIKKTRLSAGRTTATISLTVYGEASIEGDEGFQVELLGTDNSDVALRRSVGTVIVEDDDAAAPVGPTLSIGTATVAEGDVGKQAAKLTLTLSQPLLVDTMVDWHTVDGTATSPSDYLGKPRRTKIRAGATTAVASVPVYGDLTPEINEDFVVQITGTDNPAVVASDRQALVRIVNDDERALWAWGDHADGRTGLGAVTGSVTNPTQVAADTDWIAVSAGVHHSLAVRTDGTLWAWGSNANGELGLGDTTSRSSPTRVGTDTNWVTVSTGGANLAGDAHSLAIRADGTLWAWGSNNNGRTGLGLEITYDTNTLAPTQVGTDTNWAMVTAGNSHSLGVRTDGTLWAWGSHRRGKTGLSGPTSVDSNSPDQVGTDTNWATVSAAYEHSLGVRTDGTLWAWGMNRFGRTGLGITAESTDAPTQVGTATNWVTVAAGYAHSLATRTDGTLWAWGLNQNGRTGLGFTAGSTNTPAQVGTATNWATIAADKFGGHNLAIRTDGSLWAWGLNDLGRTGLGTTIGSTLIPTQVGSETNWVEVSAGQSHSLAIRTA